jgi:predicted dehydrogenase
MFKVGVIGCGSIMKGAHLPAYKQMKEKNDPIVVEAYCDIKPEQLEGLEGRLYTDVDEMLAAEQGKLDFIDICVPTYLHAEIAIKAMEAGFHVLSEKPMARTVEQGQQMIEAAKRTGKLLMSAYCNRFYDAARYIRDLIQTGELGKVRNAEFCREGGPAPTGADMWFRNAELSGGAMLDLHIHDVDMIRWMFGMPKSVNAIGQSIVTEGGYDVLSANFLYENNMFVHAFCDWYTEHDKFNTRVIRVNFEKGYVYVDRTPERTAFVKVTADGEVTDMSDKLNFNAYYNEIIYFADKLEKGLPVDNCLPEDSLDSVKIVMAEMQSAANGGEKVCL